MSWFRNKFPIIFSVWHFHRIYEQACSVIWCNGEDWTTCTLVDEELPEEDQFGPFSISGTFNCEQVYPGAMTRNQTLVSNEEVPTTRDGTVYTLTAAVEIDSLMTAALWGRYYSKDP